MLHRYLGIQRDSATLWGVGSIVIAVAVTLGRHLMRLAKWALAVRRCWRVTRVAAIAASPDIGAAAQPILQENEPAPAAAAAGR